MKNFINKYSLSKTLRFELIPQGKTLEYIEKKNLITQDQERGRSYQNMKKIIDGFHQDFIELAMSQVKLTKLQEFVDLYCQTSEAKKQDEKFADKFKKVQEALRKEIVQGFNSGEAKEIFAKISKKELITELLEAWMREKGGYLDNDYEALKDFKSFTTYFTGFNENRKNMYSDKDQSTAIAYRLINENLPKFVDNISLYKKVKEGGIDINKLEENLDLVLEGVVLDQVFSLDYFKCTLTQEGIKNYNLVIGGFTKNDGKTKVRGLNEIINLHNQQQGKNRIPKLKQLYKQILSDKERVSFLPESFEKSQEVLDAIEEYYKANLLDFKPSKEKEETENVLIKIKELIFDIKTYDLNKIYLKNDTKLTSISQKIFDNYCVFGDALNFYYDKIENPKFEEEYQKAKTDTAKEKLEKKKEKFTNQPHISIVLLQKAVDKYLETLDDNHKLKEKYQPNCIADYFHSHFFSKQNDNGKEFDFVSNIEAKYSCIKGILNNDYPLDKELHQEKDEIANIKKFLDGLMEMLHFIKPLALPKDSSLEKDESFYGQFSTYFEQLDLLILLYNKVRNYASQKPYSVKKIKLNFENSYFLSGWATEYSSKGGLIIRKDNNFYLVIVDKKLSNDDVIFLKENSDLNLAQRVVVDFQKPDNKNIPRLFIRSKGKNYAPAVEKYNLPIGEVIEIYDSGKFKTEYKKVNQQEFKQSLEKLIDYFKNGFTKHESYKHYKFSWKDSKEYQDIGEFYKNVESSCYQLTFEDVNFDNLLNLVNQGKLYLFKIHNKDFSPNSKGKPNLHTTYWKALFDEENLKNVIYKLNGQAEIFYREKSIKDLTIHKANEPIANKNPLSIKKESIFEYDIIKDKRYTVDKFQFHVPITMNFKAEGSEYLNSDVLDYLKNNPDVNIIGLDRGERHLTYLSLIDQKGNILRQESFNIISDEKRDIKTDYWKLLDKKENEKKKAQENWGIIENIKELKEGYLSQVIHKISKMMVENNAIVVMEDLNSGFKRSRFKVEKQIYQKLEKKLIDKLNYLVLKDKQPNETGGLYKALQLTNKFESFQKLDKQSGFLFYVPAWNTSKIDPTTGFVNLFYTKYESVEKAKEFFLKFADIRFNANKNYFEFEVKKYSQFNAKAEGTRQDWVICTNSDRIITFRNSDKNNNWDNKKVVLSDEFKALFNEFKIDFKTNLKNQIINQNDKKFFEKLLHLFKLTLQMRNSITNSEVDYLISPVINSKGEFYDSRNADKTLPKDADANGAYHIAKKGWLVLNKINKLEEKDKKKPDLAISNKEWLEFVQKKTIL
jgi:CRISPR-associated protein Cpf1